jgi:hypothetical protein
MIIETTFTERANLKINPLFIYNTAMYSSTILLQCEKLLKQEKRFELFLFYFYFDMIKHVFVYIIDQNRTTQYRNYFRLF